MSAAPRPDETTIAELAVALGINKRPAEARAARGRWPYREEPVRGGRRRLYEVDALPGDVALALRRHRARTVAAPTVRPEQLAAIAPDPAVERAERQRRRAQAAERYARLSPSDPKRLRAEARRWLLDRWAAYAQALGLSESAAARGYLADIASGAVELPSEHLRWLPGGRAPDRATLYRWQAAYQESGAWGLTDGFGTRKGRSKIASVPELAALIERLLLARPGIAAKQIKSLLRAEHRELDVVSEKSIERHIRQWREQHSNAALLAENPDAWKSRRQSAMGSASEGVERLNQVWEVDATPGDWLLVDGRHSVSGVIDVYSRTARLVVTKTPRAASHLALLRRTMLDPLLGVPEVIRHDQGQDYVAKRLVQFCTDLDIERDPCPPFTPERKPHIERFFRTMAHGLLELLPGYAGHNVAAREAIRARESFAARLMQRGGEVEVPLTAGELQATLDRWLAHVYEHNPHAGLDGRTPYQVLTAWRGERRRPDERALDLLLDHAGRRMVTKKGIRLDCGSYIHAALGEWIGEWVDVYRDPLDLGRVVVHGTLTTELARLWSDHATGEIGEPGQRVCICIAEDPDRTGISRAEVAAAAKARQNAAKRLLVAAGREAKRALKGVDVVEAVIAQREREMANVAAFPGRVVPHVTEALRAAADAADQRERMDNPVLPPAMSEDERAEHERRIQANARRDAEIHELAEGPKERYARWMRLARRIDAGESVAADLRERLAEYRATRECELMQEMFEEFGLPIDERASGA